MLIVNVINTLPNIEDRRINVRCPRRVKCRSKRTEEGKKCFHNKYLLVPEMTDKEKKRALRSTFLSAILSPTFSQRAASSGRTGKQRLLQTIGRDSLNTSNVLPS